MKFAPTSLIALVMILPIVAALPEPGTPAPTALLEQTGLALEKRDNAGVVKVDGLRYRRCPRTSCDAVGQYPKGTKITIKCYTRDHTTVVEGDAGWAKLKNGYWVALAYGKYVSWTGYIPYCSS